MKTRTILIASMTTLILAVSALAHASDTIEAAEYAARNLIRAKVGRQFRVVFDSHSEKLLSLTEVVVSGTGHVANTDDWDFGRAFSYSVKVTHDGSRTRDLEVTFTNGDKHAESGGWKNSSVGTEYVHVTRPHSYEKLDSGNVVFEGVAKADVSIVVYNKRNERVAAHNVAVRNGRFRTTVNLPNGTFRAVVAPDGWDVGDEIRFSVNDNSHDWGVPSSYFKVSEPGKDGRITQSRVTFAGNSSERSVWLQLWDSRNNRVVNREIPVKDRYWNSQVVLDDGSYRCTLKSGSGAETRFFTVETGKKKPAGKPSQGMVSVRVLAPKRDARVSGPRVTVSGNSSETSVFVTIWDDRNNRVVERSVPTVDRYFNTSIPLSQGRYRVKVSGRSGNDYEEFWFTVR